jgi:hypothetical protein
VRSRAATIGILAAALAALSCLAVWPAFHDPVEWTPDALYYQARVLELRGEDNAVDKVFEGPLAAELRARDPGHTGNEAWVDYNEPFYERRVAVPLAAAALYPVTEERSLLDLSLVGYIAAVLALFGLLLLRFRVALAATVAAAAALLPPLTLHSSFPLTDSWGLALEIVALGAAILALERGLAWLPLWIGAIGLLAFTRDSMWIPILAVGWCALRSRSRVPVTLFATGIAAALPALLLFTTPVRELLALLVNDSEPSSDTSLGFIASHYPGALVELLRANVGFLRRGEWYTALFLVGGVLALLLLVWRRPETRTAATTLMTAGTVFALGYVLAAPVFSAFRLELVFVPMAAWGVALTAERAAAHLGERDGVLVRRLAGFLEPRRMDRPV